MEIGKCFSFISNRVLSFIKSNFISPFLDFAPMNAQNFLLVFLGSGIGGCLRLGVSLLAKNYFPVSFPLGTLVANFLACILAGWLISKNTGPFPATFSWHILLVVGICGGFSTFSTFGFETWEMLAADKWGLALVYVLASVFLGLFAMWIFLKN